VLCAHVDCRCECRARGAQRSGAPPRWRDVDACRDIGWCERPRPGSRRQQWHLRGIAHAQGGRGLASASPPPPSRSIAASSPSAAPSWSAQHHGRTNRLCCTSTPIRAGGKRKRHLALGRRAPAKPWPALARLDARTEPASHPRRDLPSCLRPRFVVPSVPRFGRSVAPSASAAPFSRGAALRFRSACGRTAHARQAQERRRL
jgi:hypothetical protein